VHENAIYSPFACRTDPKEEGVNKDNKQIERSSTVQKKSKGKYLENVWKCFKVF
jgi:hypothetical protein